jgi:hypothetical protein
MLYFDNNVNIFLQTTTVQSFFFVHFVRLSLLVKVAGKFLVADDHFAPNTKMRALFLTLLLLAVLIAVSSAVNLERVNKVNKLSNEDVEQDQDIAKRRIAFLEERINQAAKSQDSKTVEMLRAKLQQFQDKAARADQMKAKSKLQEQNIQE